MLFGATDLLGLLLTPKAEIAAKPGAVTLKPGATFAFSHAMVVGTGDLGTLTTPLWAERKVATGAASGKVLDTDGKPVAGVRISAILEGKPPRAMTQFLSGPDGVFGGALPPGSYRFAGDAPGRVLVADAKASVEAGKAAAVGDVTFSLPGSLAIAVKDGTGNPSPAKVTVVCDGPCAVPQSSLYRDVSFDKKPDNLDSDGDGKPDTAVFDIAFVPPDGKLDLPLPPGNYTVTLSRGPVYSLWPAGAGAVKAGQPVTVAAGATAKLDAVLHKVVDTAGHLCGDFHVHAINSPDAPVPNVDRVLSMAAEGVDVMVSTDHDYVTDFGPAIAAAKAEAVVAAIPGVELTTFDYGHYNGFPMPVKAGDVNGGAPDWGNGEKAGMTPAHIAQALGAPDPARVAQINHPDGGYWKVIELDALTGVTLADPTKFRMPPVVADPKTGDTKLFTNQFTAVEILNGYANDKFLSCIGWWMPLLSTGTRFTATAVSDTHNWTSSQSGGPRSWVRVGAGKDKVQGLDIAGFAKDINAGKVVGSSGPFVVVRATTEGGIGT
ncbi:MAG: CehA/McbA family metallohydrolase, partial [Deltaproteobacteria bacterium]|nr:CehA/McbA family metallohydrolase [Deltaproteobacteria bacterium]